MSTSIVSQRASGATSADLAMILVNALGGG